MALDQSEPAQPLRRPRQAAAGTRMVRTLKPTLLSWPNPNAVPDARCAWHASRKPNHQVLFAPRPHAAEQHHATGGTDVSTNPTQQTVLPYGTRSPLRTPPSLSRPRFMYKNGHHGGVPFVHGNFSSGDYGLG